MKNAELVTMYKGDQTRQFTRRNLEVLGTDTYGWKLIPEVPKEVIESLTALNNSLEIDSQLPLMDNSEPSEVNPTPPTHKPRGRKKK